MGTVKNYFLALSIVLCAGACKDKESEYDAAGMFEVQDVTVSSEISGRLVRFDVKEGDRIEAGEVVGLIDTMQLHWMKSQAEQAILAIRSRIPDVDKQLASYRQQLKNGEAEEKRVERLLAGGAATQKQYDDAKNEVAVGRYMLEAQTNQLEALVASAEEKIKVYELKIKQVEDQIRRCVIRNPLSGVVLSKYIEQDELAAPVKALYKIGDLENMYLKIYLENSVLDTLKIGSPVEVYVGNTDDSKRQYAGRVVWISPEAEFVPTAVQTQDERENLVYAVKVHVKNDGLLRVGMYADVKL